MKKFTKKFLLCLTLGMMLFTITGCTKKTVCEICGNENYCHDKKAKVEGTDQTKFWVCEDETCVEFFKESTYTNCKICAKDKLCHYYHVQYDVYDTQDWMCKNCANFLRGGVESETYHGTMTMIK